MAPESVGMYSMPESEEEEMKMPESKYNLGDKVKEQITGCIGVVIAVCFWIDGSISYTVQPTQLFNGSPAKLFEMEEEFLLEKDERCQD